MTNEKFSEDTKNAIDSALEIATTSIQSIEKLTHIQLETSKQIFAETSHAIKELTNVTEPKEVYTKVNEIAVKAIEKNIASTRDVYDILSEVRTKLQKATEENVQKVQEAALKSVDSLAKFSPGSAQAASDSLKSWIANANQAIKEINKVAAQMGEFASNNFANATNIVKIATRKSTTKK